MTSTSDEALSSLMEQQSTAECIVSCLPLPGLLRQLFTSRITAMWAEAVLGRQTSVKPAHLIHACHDEFQDGLLACLARHCNLLDVDVTGKHVTDTALSAVAECCPSLKACFCCCPSAHLPWRSFCAF